MKTNRATNMARNAQVIAGIDKHLKNVSTVPVDGSTTTPADVVKLLQSGIDAATFASTARANWLAAAAAARALDAKLTHVTRAVRQYVINAFGATSPVLADFGFTPSKRAALTPEQKTARALKAQATRAARHTKGTVQKKAVKGDVTGIVVTPVTTPGSPTPNAAPSSSTGPAPGPTPAAPGPSPVAPGPTPSPPPPPNPASVKATVNP